MKYPLVFSVGPGTQYQLSVQGPANSDPGTTQPLDQFRTHIPGGTVVIQSLANQGFLQTSATSDQSAPTSTPTSAPPG